MSDSEVATGSSSPRKRQRLSASPAASPARSVACTADEDESASVISVSSRDTRNSDNEDDDVIEFSDLEADSSSHTAVLHTSAPIQPMPRIEEGTVIAASSSKKRKAPVPRYFGGEDLSLKCFNCGAAGHKSDDCPVDRPCYICGQSLTSHSANKRGCPNEPCWRCGDIGHQKNVSSTS